MGCQRRWDQFHWNDSSSGASRHSGRRDSWQQKHVNLHCLDGSSYLQPECYYSWHELVRSCIPRCAEVFHYRWKALQCTTYSMNPSLLYPNTKLCSRVLLHATRHLTSKREKIGPWEVEHFPSWEVNKADWIEDNKGNVHCCCPFRFMLQKDLKRPLEGPKGVEV